MTAGYRRLQGLIRALASGLLDVRPEEQRRQQRRLEAELFTHCDDLEAGEAGLHWAYDWLFGLERTFSLAVGRVLAPARSTTHLSFKSQPRGKGVVYDVALPAEVWRYDEAAGVLSIEYRGPADVRVQRHDGEEAPRRLAVAVTLRKACTDGARPWSSRGALRIGEDGGLLETRWDYRVTRLVDRPDYSVESLLGMLRADVAPGSLGHFIPALSADMEGEVSCSLRGEPATRHRVWGGYVDGNFTRTRDAGRMLQDHWGWFALPRLWTTEGAPSEAILMGGFFRAPRIPGLTTGWPGLLIGRLDPGRMTHVTLRSLLSRVTVRQHGPRFLDLTVVTADRSHRVTVQIWARPVVATIALPGGEVFRDHQDLLAEAGVVVERRSGLHYREVQRLVTHMAGCEFGEAGRAVGDPDYPCHAPVPQRPAWLVRALARLPAAGVPAPQTAAARLGG